jgi:hypothetical protein
MSPLTPTAALHQQAQAERLAGQLLTAWVHSTEPAARARLLTRACWEAGRGVAYGEIAEQMEAAAEKPRSNRR